MAQEATRLFMYGKIHRCTVTEANLHYIGSITIDPLLLDAAGIYPYTQVDVVNINNGNRLQTYAIPGTAGAGEICLNGAAAHLFEKNDLAIIMAYENCPISQLVGRDSKAVMVDENNLITKILSYQTPSMVQLREGSAPSRAHELYPQK